MVAHWPALKLWRGDSGLARLAALAGDAHVEALASPAEGRAYGDMQHLVLLGCTLRELLDRSLERQLAERAPPGAPRLQLYLAQSPLCSAGSGGSGGAAGSCGQEHGSLQQLRPAPLQPLMQDLGVPALLHSTELSQINFWASMSSTRSSLHYDPYQNLLCVVRGSKSVWLAPPSATPWLSPQPLTHESANHSPADLSQPDLRRFPGLARALPLLQRFQVAAGDALYIPEGWWHQVDSAEGTLAANFWWEGAVSRQLGGHMDRFYLRRLLQSLLEKQKQEALAALPLCDLLQLARACGADDSSGSSQRQQQGASEGKQQGAPSEGPSGAGEEPASPGAAAVAAAAAAEGWSPQHGAALSLLEAAVAEHRAAGSGSPPPTLVTSVVATLAAESAQALLDVLLRLRRRSPALAAQLLLHSLGPAGWELLSGCMERRQEELAEAGGTAAAEEAVGAACEELYSAVPDRPALLEAILAAKEAFSRQALRAVLDAELAGCL
ncbi:hypothetical protein ABPG75_006154 [Micractinium tetrahymenae]